MPVPKKTRRVNKPLISDTVYQALRNWIVDGVLRPGEAMKDGEIAEKLGVSRTPIREALKRLEADGLVDTSANRWTRVSEIAVEDIENLFPIIKCLDVLALTSAFPRMNPGGVEEMERESRRLGEALSRGNYDLAAKSGRALHDAYVKRCGNPELIKLNRNTKAKARRLRIFYYKSAHIELLTAVDEHKELIEAIAAQRLEDSKAILSRHWDHVISQIRAAASDAPER